MVPVSYYLALSAALFAIGFAGVLVRRNVLVILMSVELMINAVTINLVAFSRLAGGVTGQVFAVFTIALTVAEVVVGLAIVILLFRWRREIAIDSANELRH